ncbi:LysM peptidoglycan-binding domain-containing protein [Pseudovibrio sp. Tun.PSC04-5.I4]|uniref:LysM peptidoglycan-binding domain-containing protein n=1 Tax=Pseudovibrio sp. Tun.PSC04-5.I4 TaxID=1798213 RepID=UPI00087EA064|nr:LysM peptidoglycan-binding domain-containing protein [Pseudovibrio sp. Tun.PSC04-5.I4]SDQ93987.1 Nucleoid-associated protein YgaU, contains BON and LysM domains [Pseudovibrio sp. Tun.PSC04-5.I4]
MSKTGMNLLLTVAVVVAAGAIGAGAYYLSKEETSVVAEAEKAVAKLQAAANGKVQLNSSNSQKEKAETAPEVDVNVDTTAVTTSNVPSFDVMRVEPSGDAVVAGQAEAGSIIALISNGDVIGKGIANNRGEFAIVLEQPLKPGDHDVSLEAVNQETQEKSDSTQHIAVSVPEDKSGEVLVVLNEPDAPSKILQLPETPAVAEPVILVKNDKPKSEVSVTPQMKTETAIQNETVAADVKTTPAAAEKSIEQPAAPVQVAVESSTEAGVPKAASEVAVATEQTPAPVEQPVETAIATPNTEQTIAAVEPVATQESQLAVKAVESEKGKVFVAGESEPGSQVRVYVGKELVGEVKTNTEGRWLLEAEKAIPAGEVEVRADKVGSIEGKVEARAEVVFTKGENDVIMIPVRLVAEGSGSRGSSATAGIGELPNVIIRRGDNLWSISRRLYGQGTRYTTIYQANNKQIRNPDLIYPGQVFMLPVADLNWKTINN